MNIYFCISAGGAPLAIGFYLLIFLAVRRSSQLGKDFQKIFYFSTFINIMTYVNAILVVKTPQAIEPNSAFGDFYIKQFPRWLCVTLGSLTGFSFYAQFSIVVLLSINRFTCISFPYLGWFSVSHAAFWKKYTYPSLVFILLLSTALVAVNFNTDTSFGDYHGQVKLLKNNVKEIFLANLIFALVTVIMTAILNGGTLFLANKVVHQKSTERSLLIYMLINFLVAFVTTLFLITSFFNQTHPNDFVAVSLSLLLPILSDVITLIDPFLLIIVSRQVRKQVLRMFGLQKMTSVVETRGSDLTVI